ncbi:MAG: hypothetical protein FalmKO_08490 [Falsiruegeria mediterranea]
MSQEKGTFTCPVVPSGLGTEGKCGATDLEIQPVSREWREIAQQEKFH